MQRRRRLGRRAGRPCRRGGARRRTSPAPSSRARPARWPRRRRAGRRRGGRLGASAMIAPTSRSRFAQPSSRRPMPGAKESSTVEWQSAHWMPIERGCPSPSKKPVTPTTAFEPEQRERRRRIVEVDLAAPELRAERAAAARPRRPSGRRASAVRGLTPAPTPPCASPAIASVQAGACRPRTPRRRRCRSGRCSRPSSTSASAFWRTTRSSWARARSSRERRALTTARGTRTRAATAVTRRRRVVMVVSPGGWPIPGARAPSPRCGRSGHRRTRTRPGAPPASGRTRAGGGGRVRGGVGSWWSAP